MSCNTIKKKILICILFVFIIMLIGCSNSNSNSISSSTPNESDVPDSSNTSDVADSSNTSDASDSSADTTEDQYENKLIDIMAFSAYQSLEMYTYADLENDTKLLEEYYGDLLQVDSLGTTVDGHNIFHFVVGSPNSEYKVFINGGIHGREYMSSQLVMKQLITYVDHIRKEDSYKDFSYNDLWDKCSVHVVPMINPDGVSISQYGLDGIQSSEVRKSIESIAQRENGLGNNRYFVRWKSNGNGVDLNRNFDALWETYDDRVGQPSADHYKGTSAGCEIESKALIDLTHKQKFDATLSYHTQGSVIYWYFGQEGTLFDDTKSLSELVSGVTGYPTDANFESLDPAGYKDWCISKMGIPSLTIEIGTETSPVPYQQFDSIWQKNQTVWEEVIIWLN